MNKRLLMIGLMIALLVVFAGCGKNDPGETTAEPDAPAAESVMPVVDRNGERLGGIDSRAVCSAIDRGIFYSIFALNAYEFTATAEYRFFDKEARTDVLLGKFEGQGYEASYTRTELDGAVYPLVIKGKMDGDSAPLVLLAFDPAKQTMKTFTVSENGFPYADMAAVNGRLYIMNHEMGGRKTDTVYEFDPSGETVKEVVSFASDTDSLRGISSADDGFYLLRLKINGGENEMFVDLYGTDGVRKSEQSVNEMMVNAIMTLPGMLNRQDALNELGMHVTHFSVADDRYLCYENFSVSRVIVDLNSGDAILAKDDIYTFSTGNGSPVLYKMDYDSDNVGKPEIIELKAGALVNHDFQPIDTHKLMRNVSRSRGGTWLVMTSDDSRTYLWTLAVHLWTEP